MKLFEQSSLSSMIEDAERWKGELAPILASQSVVIRGLYEPDRLLELRESVFQLRKTHGFAGNMKYNEATPDHVKIVDKAFDDARPTRFVLSQFFPWNTPVDPQIATIARDLMTFRNICSGLAPDTGLSTDCDYISWPSFIHYRRGGDFLAAHRDDYAFQTILVLSQQGRDFEQGGAFYLDESRHHYLEPALEFGDLVLLRSDLVHGVHAIDPQASDDGSQAGRWIMFCPLIRRDAILRPA